MIYIKVAEMVAESAKLPLEKVLAEIPFSLYQGANGYIQQLIPNDDELFEFDRYGGDTLLCIWSEEAFHREFSFPVLSRIASLISCVGTRRKALAGSLGT